MQIPHEAEDAARQRVDHLEALIDEAGAESFPASDPPAVHPESRPVTTSAATGLEQVGTPS
ncbi:MAG: hypothetical protein EPN70_07645 [Paraburkholderia sp.]|uniref:hypothetical protein n=1 Tax=Paraburkholderia sp. TaxID=1926495 RepID=UPI001206AAB9|nr:hypothetical protein [Paraburkholderia sp.]TAM05736.1 MAG: hypothetical protein EPN70_07645 [Paraburkholderia sp.]